jgi:hypothetical protein
VARPQPAEKISKREAMYDALNLLFYIAKNITASDHDKAPQLI